ncbi:MAG: biotin--[acetyl-CoA-carboxylase] ligase [Sulfolobales archaeon]|nr:biotin--[acetyl-CoA-carboxylase] ligase [Sulfolobales archaeon]MCX8186573.1 biotin--[acetyl-CoA-carboxylase] ligase [Sulfolobales archaeon]MDW7970077.1 biotin--[acetyl-CoA-carboxylase] ligase [Sulfolobales archaeon]
MKVRIYRFKECVSTQDIAKKLADDGAAEGTVVIADKMASGRGRLNRVWVADEGGLWFTIILRPKSLSNVQLVTLMAGVSVVEGIKKLYDVPLELKWPNDVLLNGRKLCGVLTEARISNNVIDYLLLGIGVNVNNELRGDLKHTAISLKSYLGHEVPINDLFIEILKCLEVLYESLQSGSLSYIVNLWKKYSTTLGRCVRVFTADGVVEGLAYDVGLDGSLVINVGRGVEKVYSGDVIHLTFGESKSCSDE